MRASPTVAFRARVWWRYVVSARVRLTKEDAMDNRRDAEAQAADGAARWRVNLGQEAVAISLAIAVKRWLRLEAELQHPV